MTTDKIDEKIITDFQNGLKNIHKTVLAIAGSYTNKEFTTLSQYLNEIQTQNK